MAYTFKTFPDWLTDKTSPCNDPIEAAARLIKEHLEEIWKHSAELRPEQCVNSVAHVICGYKMCGHLDDSINKIERSWWHAQTAALADIIQQQKAPQPPIARKRALTVEDCPRQDEVVVIWCWQTMRIATAEYQTVFGGTLVLCGFRVCSTGEFLKFTEVQGWCPIEK